MAFYEYLCRDCDTSFELRRAMVDADDPVICPNGHTDVRRKLSVFASIGASSSGSSAASASAAWSSMPSGGGCCGGSCGCGH